MVRSNKWQKHLELLPTIIIALIIYKYIDTSSFFNKGFGFVISLFSYFIWGAVLAYFLNGFVKFVEQYTRWRRGWVILFVYLAVLLSLVLLVRMMTPRLKANVVELMSNIPNYYKVSVAWVQEQIDTWDLVNNAELMQLALAIMDQARTLASGALNGILNSIIGGLTRGTSALVTMGFAVIISIYMLIDKEGITEGTKKLLRALIDNEDNYRRLVNFAADVNDIFSRYISGRLIESAILGVLCYITMAMFRIPYAAIFGLIVGVTNLIPYFGPTLGTVPIFIVTLFSGFWLAVTSVILVFLLQQFDNLYLVPIIVGEKVGLKPLWIILAVSIGGKLSGVVGMFLGVPAVAVLKRVLDEFLDWKLSLKEAEIVKGETLDA